MKKLLVVLALLLVASPAMAALELTMTHSVDLIARRLYVDAVITGNTFDPADGINVNLFQGGILLSGADASIFTASMNSVRMRTAAQMDLALGGNFAWKDWTSTTNAQTTVPAWLFLSEGTFAGWDEDDNAVYAFHDVNQYQSGIAMRIIFTWAAEHDAAVANIDNMDLVARLVGWDVTDPSSLPLLQQERIDSVARSLDIVITNQDYLIGIPEPATMGLLGLGLVGLIARRRRSSK